MVEVRQLRVNCFLGQSLSDFRSARLTIKANRLQILIAQRTFFVSQNEDKLKKRRKDLAFEIETKPVETAIKRERTEQGGSSWTSSYILHHQKQSPLEFAQLS